jgi:hypothetical protein
VAGFVRPPDERGPVPDFDESFERMLEEIEEYLEK